MSGENDIAAAQIRRSAHVGSKCSPSGLPM